jgi:NadR type nicotinamide-nucleotide adenylyltransferase
MIKVTLFGSESTGKTTLAQQLAAFFQTDWVPEYSRIYQEKHARPLRYRDVTPIARGQIRLEKYYLSKTKNLLICDTDILETKVYSEAYYNRCPRWVVEAIPCQYADLYLLTDIDLPWQPDGIRDRPDQREMMHQRFEQALLDHKLPFALITGPPDSRFRKARHAIQAKLK